MSVEQDHNTGHNDIQILRGRVDSLSLYEITDLELDTLERGSPYSIHLNFGISLLTMGLSFLTSLLVTDIESVVLLVVFVVLAVIGITGGTLLVLLGHKASKDVTEVIGRIKTRITEIESASGV